jgi:ATP-dependent DNA helicase RecQ
MRYFGQPAPTRCDRCDVCRGVQPAAAIPDGSPHDTRLASLEMFRAGASVDEVARARGLGSETVRGHLADLIESGIPVPLERVVAPERAQLIVRASRVTAPMIDALKRALPPDYLFGEIRVVLAALRAGALSASAGGPPPTAPSAPAR